MTCKDCVHYDMCLETFRKSKERGNYSNTTEEEYFSNWFDCDFFLPKSRFVELPCEVGSTVYLLMGGFVEEMKLSHLVMSFKPNEQHPLGYINDLDDFGKTVFLSKDEAENALRERSK